MLVVMKAQATEEQIGAVCQKIEELGYRAHPMPGAQRTAIGITGNHGEVEPGTLDEMPGVQELIRVSKPYKLVSRDVKQENTVITFPGTDATFGGHELAVIAGPCAIENREQAFAIAEQVCRAGAQFFRGGAYKPRTSPYSFQGLGEAGLQIMAEIRDKFGMTIVTEAIDNESLELVEKYADVIQIGARNMQNFSLLKRADGAQTGAAEARHVGHARRVADGRRVRDERGQLPGHPLRARRADFRRPHPQHARPGIVPAVKRLSHLPILVDPSHGTGKRNKVTPLSRAAIAVGADGLIVEVHHEPDRAMSDGIQSLYPEQFDELMKQVRQFAPVVGRMVPAIGVHTPAVTGDQERPGALPSWPIKNRMGWRSRATAIAVMSLSFFLLAQESPSKLQKPAVCDPDSLGANTGLEVVSDLGRRGVHEYLADLLITVRKNWPAVVPIEARPPAKKKGMFRDRILGFEQR